MNGGHLKCCLCRTTDSPVEPNNPYRNLATEEFLIRYLAEHLQDDMAILYLWQNMDCVVFGRNQNPSNECRLDVMENLEVLPVRRKTGGGAVFHDLQNLNFSFIVPAGYYDRDASMQIVARALQLCGIDAVVNGRNDIVVGDCKVSGNAYLSKYGVCLHHGTLLIATDTEKMERLLTVDADKFAGKGIRSVRSRVKNLKEIMPTLTVEDYGKALEECFLEYYAGNKNAVFEPLALEGKDMDRIRHLQEEYASKEWIFGHEIRQIWSINKRFDWGSCNIQYTGASYRIYSDTLYTEAFEQVKKIVQNQDFGKIYAKSACVEKIVKMPDTRQKKMFQDICGMIGAHIKDNVEAR